MYPLTCYAGFPVPIKAGKFNVYGYSVAADDMTADMRLILVDDENIQPGDKQGYCLNSATENRKVITDYKGLANVGTCPEPSMFAEPITIRRGLSIYAENIKAGTLCVYAR